MYGREISELDSLDHSSTRNKKPFIFTKDTLKQAFLPCDHVGDDVSDYVCLEDGQHQFQVEMTTTVEYQQWRNSIC